MYQAIQMNQYSIKLVDFSNHWNSLTYVAWLQKD